MMTKEESLKSESVYRAVSQIRSGNAKKIQVDNDIKVYKIPSNNPDKYTIRVDIQVRE